MSVFKADCPYCFTRSVAFTIVGGPEIGSYRDLWDVLAFCSRCDRGIVATFSTPGTDGPEEMNPGVLPDPIAIFPRPPETAVPEHTPRNVGNYFRQARDSLASGNWDAAGVMYRKVLETCLKHRFPHHRRDDTLYKRIETAKREGALTTDLAQWGHQIRILGNYAGHEEEPFSTSQAHELDRFTEMMLIYLYSLPGWLSSARRAGEEDGSR